MNAVAALLLIFFTALPRPLAAQGKAVFYMNSEPAALRSLALHANRIDILVPVVYYANEQGLVRGSPHPRMLEAAAEHRLPVMPIVMNSGFRGETIHALLNDTEARARLAAELLERCRNHNYYGIHFDFEQIPSGDRDAFSALVRETRAVLAEGGYRLSVAVMYQMSTGLGSADYSRWLSENWLGAYDLRELAAHADFLSVMTYDQHTERTPPGAIAALPWVRQVLDHCLRLVPREKLSLGIPLYGRRWFAGAAGGEGDVVTATLKAPEALILAEDMKTTPQWDAVDAAPWFTFRRDGLREYVFFNDARSFRERYDLAVRERLHGFSAWVLGAEDPAIWESLPLAAR
jgi:spore germination protein YaaH